MNHFHRLGLASATAIFIVGPAFASGPADQGYMQAMQTMQQKTSSAPMTGNADRDFTTMMIPHHQAAVSMAKTELKYGKSAYLKRMARKIIKY